MLRTVLTLPAVAERSGLNIAKILSNCIPWGNTRASGGISVTSRCSSSDAKKDDQPKSGQVFKHERHNMYICWHPEVPFPYEMTKPIDLNAPVTESHMKIQALTPVREAFRRKHEKMMINELIKLTFTTKHKFYGKFGMKRRLYLRQIDPNKQTRNRKYL